MTTKEKTAAVILAAGAGKRMKNPDLAKVMARIDGKPLIEHVIEGLSLVAPEKIVVVVGHHKEQVVDFLKAKYASKVEFAEQKEQLGTGHAADQAEPALADFDGNVLILAGDVPLLRPESLAEFSSVHSETESDLSVLSARTDNPTGYGRIVRDSTDAFLRIVEEKDADSEIKQIREINTGIYILKAEKLFPALKKVKNSNAQNEYYLTDIIEILKSEGASVNAFSTASFEETQGVNSVEDLRRAEEYYMNRKQTRIS